MLRIYREINSTLQTVDTIPPSRAWVHLVAPSENELALINAQTGIMIEYLKAALDEEERPRQEAEGNQALIIINIPARRSDQKYTTIPLGITVTPDILVTVCLEETPVISDIINKYRIHPGKKTRLLLQILYRTSTIYIDIVKRLNKKAEELEQILRRSLRNEVMFEMMEVQKSLVYLSTALKANQIVMEKILRSFLRPVGEKKLGNIPIQLYPDDEDLLEDAITENQQALSMAEVYSNILSETMDAFASIVNNNLNIVMKFLTAVTILLTIPSVIGTFFGMNVLIPLKNNVHAFPIIVLFSSGVCAMVGFYLWKKNMF